MYWRERQPGIENRSHKLNLIISKMCFQYLPIERDCFDYLQLIMEFLAPIVGVVGAYLIFRRQIRHERRRELEQKEDELKDLKVFMISSLKNLPIAALSQANHFDMLVSVLEKKRVQKTIGLKASSSFDQQWFYDLDRKVLLKAFLKYSKGDKAWSNYLWNQMYIQISILQKIKSVFEEEFAKFTKELNNYEGLFNESISPITNYLDLVRVKAKANQPLSNEETDFLNATSEWLLEKDREVKMDMFFRYRTLVLPLSPFFDETKMLDLLQSYRDCSYAFTSYIGQRDLMRMQFSYFSKSIKSAVARLKVVERNIN